MPLLCATELCRMIEISQALSGLAKLASRLHDEVVAREALALAEQLERRELNVLVVGQFKRGKSSLVNALLHEDLMPTGALPLTRVATAIRYGDRPRILVQFADGVLKEATPEELAIYVSESTNPKNAFGIEYVNVDRPLPLLRDLVLFDTPGVGSIHEHNTAAARATLGRIDAAILVVGPEPPIGAEELAYAREVAASSTQLFVVFNKSDIAGAALSELLDFTRDALEDVAGENAALFPMSVTRARSEQEHGRDDPGFAVFVQTLREFVDRHGARTLEASARRRTSALFDRISALLQMRERAAALPRDERVRRRAALEKALQALDDRVRFLTLVVDDDVRLLRQRVDEELDRRHDRERAAFRSIARAIAAESSRERRRSFLEGAVHDKAHAWRRDAVAYAQRTLREYATKYARLLGELEEAVIKAGCDALHFDAGKLAPHQISFAPAELRVVVSIDPSTGLEVLRDFLTEMLPKGARSGVLERRFEHVLDTELDALRGKLRYGVAHDLEPWRRAVRATISSTLDATRGVVLGAFSDSTQSGAEERTKKDLEAERRDYDSLRSGFERVQPA
jgi:hypothetical protein